MNGPALALLDVALNAAAIAANDPLALLQEGGIKVAIIKGLLQAGCRIREGSPRTQEDWLIGNTPDKPVAQLVARTGDGDTKSDIRIETPIRLVFELKVFGEIGSKDTFNRGEVLKTDGTKKNENSFLWDLMAVAEQRAYAAIVVCGARQYDVARGDRWDNRGRAAGVLLADLLPPRSELRSEILEFQSNWRNSDWLTRALLVAPPTLVEHDKNGNVRRAAEGRVIVAIRRVPLPAIATGGSPTSATR